MRDVAGKVAVITGGGSGIGRATALALARRGATVAICGLPPAAGKATADDIVAAGGRASAHEVDVTSETAMRELVDAVLSEHGVVDIVMNNAGILVAPTPTADVPLERFRRVMDVNFWGVVYGSLFFLPHLLARPEANLVNVASNAGLVAYSRVAAYNASKFGVRGFTETLRMETRRTPLRVTLVCPGNTRTSLAANSPVMEDGQGGTMQRFLDRVPGRPVEAVAEAIVRGIERDRPRVLTGADTFALDTIARLAPGAHSRILAPAIERFLDMTLKKR
jgi:NAD(P)-dependent dehydrogenase (short-subunit alcohol dehydrogenase family)